ncbi:MAG: OmpA family protein, partial [Alphaproteobacteria bacterium]
AAVAPASPMPPVAGKVPSPRASRPTPPIAEPSTQANKETDGGGSSSPAASPQIASLPPASSPEILDDGQMYRIPFGSISSDISEEGKKHLDELAQRLKKDNALRLQLLGYAAGTEDSASKARRTSLFRALSVRTYLMKQGIRSTRMDVRALGNLAEGGAPDRVDAVIRK